MSSLALLLLFATADTVPPAYTADVVVTYEGKVTHTRTGSDGVVTKTEGPDGKSGSFLDNAKHVMWVYGPTFPCVELPMGGAEAKTKSREEPAGDEIIDGHPTKKVKVTTTTPTATMVEYIWRAVDLHDIVIRRRSVDGKSETRLEHIVLRAPDPKWLAFPSAICKTDPSLVASQPKAPGGSRTIRFSEGACKLIVPLPIAMSIPSDYSIRTVERLGCFWGAEDDLARLLANERQADFDSIRRGVFWCRVSENTEYDPVSKHFVSEMGNDQQWARAMQSVGARNVVLTPRMVGIFPSLGVTVSMKGQKVYMLYLAIPNTESLAILINYHPAGKGSAADDAVWKHFVDSVQAAR